MSQLDEDKYGFGWKHVSVRRTAELPDGRLVITIFGWKGDERYFTEDQRSEVDIYISKNGNAITVHRKKGTVNLTRHKEESIG